MENEDQATIIVYFYFPFSILYFPIYPSTTIPILLAVPSTIFMASSMS